MQKKIFDIVAQVVENDFFGIDTSFYKPAFPPSVQ